MPRTWPLSSRGLRGSRGHGQVEGGRGSPLFFGISLVPLRVPSPSQHHGGWWRDGGGRLCQPSVSVTGTLSQPHGPSDTPSSPCPVSPWPRSQRQLTLHRQHDYAEKGKAPRGRWPGAVLSTSRAISGQVDAAGTRSSSGTSGHGLLTAPQHEGPEVGRPEQPVSLKRFRPSLGLNE